MSRVDELRALMETARVELDNARFYVDMFPGCVKGHEVHDRAAKTFSERFEAWAEADRENRQEKMSHA